MPKDAEFTWFNTKFFPARRTARPSRYEDAVLPIMQGDEVIFFTPWGPRYKWEERGTKIQDGDSETHLLAHLAQLLQELRTNMPSRTFRWVFVGADLYGMRINRLPPQVVADYFTSLQEQLHRHLPDAEFHLWSTHDACVGPYRARARATQSIWCDERLMARANNTAAGMQNGGSPLDYLVERVAEALFIMEEWLPGPTIKVSCAPRYKDDKVDLHLPRLYLVPEHLHAPWL